MHYSMYTRLNLLYFSVWNSKSSFYSMNCVSPCKFKWPKGINGGKCGFSLYIAFPCVVFFFLWFLYPSDPVCFFFQILFNVSGSLVSHFFPSKLIDAFSFIVLCVCMCVCVTHTYAFLFQWNK